MPPYPRSSPLPGPSSPVRPRDSLVPRLVAAAIGAAGVAYAQPRSVEPGIWEMQVHNAELDEARAQMQKQLADMPPAMRKQMEEMLASQGLALGDKGVRT